MQSVSIQYADELSHYFNSVAEFDIDPLLWWNAHQLEYPILSEIAWDYLCIQAISIASEQEFSLASLTINKTRTRLLPETAQTSLCLKSWIMEKIGDYNNNNKFITNNLVKKQNESLNSNEIIELSEEFSNSN